MDTITKNATFNEIRKRGFTKVTVDFEGGNDSGGVSGVVATKADGTTEQLPNAEWVSRDGMVWMPGGERRQATEEEIAADRFSRALGEPVFERWGSFAGDFHVHGQVVWDTTAGDTVTLKGEESVEHYDTFAEEW